MPSQKNTESVGALKEKLQRSQIIIATNFAGLDVATLTALRRKLKEQGVEFLVVKNTVASLAAGEVGKEGLQPFLKGPSGLVLGFKEASQCAKALDEYLRNTKIPLEIRGGVMERQALRKEDVQILATLPPRPELMARLAGQMLASISMLAGILNAPARGLATVLQRGTEKQGAQSSAEPAQESASP
ncbi:MAG: 50S ribosomal protein L10 [Dehalococcoidia bacterium]|nr:50S ribosomal protein L10 [Dehalococcoidia bacterium]